MNFIQRRNDEKLVREAAFDFEEYTGERDQPFGIRLTEKQRAEYFNIYCFSSSSRWRIKKPWSWRITGMGLGSITGMRQVNNTYYATKAEAEAAAHEWNLHACARAQALADRRMQS